MNLESAHKGYKYQDIFCAYLLLEAFRAFKEFKFFIDYKEQVSDSFDDLTIITTENKYKFQIRHSEKQDLTVQEPQN